MSDTDSIINEIASERVRQISAEGYSHQGDDIWSQGALAKAAAAYAVNCDGLWPFQMRTFKPKSARRNLIRAGALIVAEIERLDRAAAKKGGGA